LETKLTEAAITATEAVPSVQPQISIQSPEQWTLRSFSPTMISGEATKSSTAIDPTRLTNLRPTRSRLTSWKHSRWQTPKKRGDFATCTRTIMGHRVRSIAQAGWSC